LAHDAGAVVAKLGSLLARREIIITPLRVRRTLPPAFRLLAAFYFIFNIVLLSSFLEPSPVPGPIDIPYPSASTLGAFFFFCSSPFRFHDFGLMLLPAGLRAYQEEALLRSDQRMTRMDPR
jgi:hypothetical protein